MFNSDELNGKWKEIKGEITKKWGQLSDNELEVTKGNAESLVGLMQQKLGMKKEEVHQQLSEVASRWRKEGGRVVEKVADSANRKIDEAKKNLKS